MIPLSYSLRSLLRRPLTVIVTLVGLTVVVAVFAAMLMLSSGVRETLAKSGSPDNFLVLRDGATSEAVSGVSRDQVRLFSALPELAKSPSGAPLVDPELALIGGFDRVDGTGRANVAIRGVGPLAMQIRPTVKVVEGRAPSQGTSEVMIGKGIVGRYTGFELGNKVNFARRDWQIVGVFTADGAAFESEVWGDVDQLADAFQRISAYSDIVGRTVDGSVKALAARLAGDPQLSTMMAEREDSFFDSQSSSLRTLINVLGWVVAIFFAIAAALGAMITMYAQVASRIREVGTLRAIGFKRRTVLWVFLRETILLSLAGGLIGTGIAALTSLVTFSLTNGDTFTDITFKFHFAPSVGVTALIFAFLMGVIGGFLPAVRAARLAIVSATRGT
ncbi:MAG: ABC transporter permease [Myxococcales bacterium]